MKIESTRRARRLRASLFVAAAGVAAAGGAGSLAACFSSSDHGPPTSNVSGQDATAEAACTQFSANGLPLCDASLDATTGSEASADAAGPDAGDAGTTPGDAGTTPDDARTAPDAPAVVIGPLCGCGSSACDTRNGLFKCWGLNTDGQLGQGTSDNGNHPTPLLVQGISPSSCDLGRGHVCAVVDGGVQCWGENQHSQLGHDPALDDAGLVCQDPPPCNSSPTAVGLAGVTSVQVGDRHSCALAPEAGVYCWGQDQYGQAGVSGASLVNGVVAVPVPALVPVGDGGTVVEIAAGGTTSCARKMDGTVWCWGDNSSGSLGLGVAPDAATYDSNEHATPVQLSGITGAIGIAVGHRHACAILTGGQVTCWGSNDQGQLGHDPGLDPSCGGTACRTTPTTVAGLTGVSELSLGWSHTCAVTSAGTVWCWGDNSYGQLGHDPALDADGSQSFNPTPMPVTGLSSALHVAAHDLATCAVQQDSTVVCWGANFGGESGYASDAGPSSGLLNVVKGL